MGIPLIRQGYFFFFCIAIYGIRNLLLGYWLKERYQAVLYCFITYSQLFTMIIVGLISESHASIDFYDVCSLQGETWHYSWLHVFEPAPVYTGCLSIPSTQQAIWIPVHHHLTEFLHFFVVKFHSLVLCTFLLMKHSLGIFLRVCVCGGG